MKKERKISLVAPGSQSIPDLEETTPEQDPLFMDYCAQVVDCAAKRASMGKDCNDPCPNKERCDALFDKVSGLSARRRLQPEEHQKFLQQFMQLMNTEAAS